MIGVRSACSSHVTCGGTAWNERGEDGVPQPPPWNSMCCILLAVLLICLGIVVTCYTYLPPGDDRPAMWVSGPAVLLSGLTLATYLSVQRCLTLRRWRHWAEQLQLNAEPARSGSRTWSRNMQDMAAAVPEHGGRRAGKWLTVRVGGRTVWYGVPPHGIRGAGAQWTKIRLSDPHNTRTASVVLDLQMKVPPPPEDDSLDGKQLNVDCPPSPRLSFIANDTNSHYITYV